MHFMNNEMINKIANNYLNVIINNKTNTPDYLILENKYDQRNAKRISNEIIRIIFTKFNNFKKNSMFINFLKTTPDFSDDVLKLIIDNYDEIYNNDTILVKKIKEQINLKNTQLVNNCVEQSSLFNIKEIQLHLFEKLTLNSLVSFIKKYVAKTDYNSYELCNLCLQILRKFCVESYDIEQTKNNHKLLIDIFNYFLQNYRKILADSNYSIYEIDKYFLILSFTVHSPKMLFNYGLLLKILGSYNRLKYIYCYLSKIEGNINKYDYTYKLGIQLFDKFYIDDYNFSSSIYSLIRSNKFSNNLNIILNYLFDNKLEINNTDFLKKIDFKEININEFGLLLLLFNKRNICYKQLYNYINSDLSQFSLDKQFIVLLDFISDKENNITQLLKIYDFYFKKQKNESLLSKNLCQRDLYIILSSNPNKYELFKRQFPSDVLFIRDKLCTYYTYKPDELIDYIIKQNLIKVNSYNRIILLGGSKAGHGLFIFASLFNQLFINSKKIIVLAFSPQINLYKTNLIDLNISERFSSLRFYKNICCKIDYRFNESFNKYCNIDNLIKDIKNIDINIFISEENFFDGEEILLSQLNINSVYIYKLPGRVHNCMQFFNFDYVYNYPIENDNYIMKSKDEIKKFYSLNIYDYL